MISGSHVEKGWPAYASSVSTSPWVRKYSTVRECVQCTACMHCNAHCILKRTMLVTALKIESISRILGEYINYTSSVKKNFVRFLYAFLVMCAGDVLVCICILFARTYPDDFHERIGQQH